MEKFWNKYIKADSIDKQKIIKPILKRINDIIELKTGTIKGKEFEKHRTRILTTMLTSYFDDLIMVMESKGNNND